MTQKMSMFFYPYRMSLNVIQGDPLPSVYRISVLEHHQDLLPKLRIILHGADGRTYDAIVQGGRNEPVSVEMLEGKLFKLNVIIFNMDFSKEALEMANHWNIKPRKKSKDSKIHNLADPTPSQIVDFLAKEECP